MLLPNENNNPSIKRSFILLLQIPRHHILRIHRHQIFHSSFGNTYDLSFILSYIYIHTKYYIFFTCPFLILKHKAHAPYEILYIRTSAHRFCPVVPVAQKSPNIVSISRTDNNCFLHFILLSSSQFKIITIFISFIVQHILITI